jgi:CYTH domain-containing protein
MALEIERKFIVQSDGWKKHTLVKKIPMEQGYFDQHSDSIVRIRLTDVEAFITIKSSTKGLVRKEFEYEVPHADGVELIKMCVKPTVKKTRHYVVDNFNQLWEIDTFRGTNRGLVIAEIELESKKQVVTSQQWLGREVTEDERYRNTVLASNKVPKE